MEKSVDAGIDEQIVLSLQSLYRGKLVRRYLGSCFTQFSNISCSLNNPDQLPVIDFIRLNLWLSSDNIHISSKIQCLEDTNSTNTKCKFDSNLNYCHMVADSTTEIDKNFSGKDFISSIITEPEKDKADLVTIPFDQLQDQLSLLLLEKKWMERAILARIEYLTTN